MPIIDRLPFGGTADNVYKGDVAKIGSWWLKGQVAEAGEEVLWSKGANRFQGSRGVGGKLFLTDRRLLFNPHHIDALTGGKTWNVPLAALAEIGKEAKHSGKQSAFGGGFRDRLRIATADGQVELFVVNQLDEVVRRLEEAAGAGTPPGA